MPAFYRLPLAALLLSTAFLLQACTFAPALDAPATEQSLPDSFEIAEPITQDSVVLSDWWSSFEDPVLNTVVDSALSRNLDVRVAAARVVEVQRQYRIARAPLFPSLGVGGEASRTDVPANVGVGGNIGEGIPNFPDRFTNEMYSLSGTLSYEVDLWGRVRNEMSAALRRFEATEADLRGVRIGVVSEAIRTYLEVQSLQEQIALTQESIDLLEERVVLTEERYQRGIIASFELYSIRQTFESTRTGLPLLEARLADAEGRLGVVLGMFPASVRTLLTDARGVTLPSTPIPAGLPARLLDGRPDVKAALLRLEAARQSVGAARAQLLPSLSLTATGGVQSMELTDLLDAGQQFSNLIANLTGPLFRGGQLRANVDASRARLDQAVASYEKALLTAFQEVSATLVAHEKQRERYEYLLQEQAFAQASLETARERYQRGIGDYIALLDAERNVLRVQSALAVASQDVASARLAVYRALGGTWREAPST